MEIIKDENLEQVVGGLFVFQKKDKKMIYTHSCGTVTEHTILDYDKAWELSSRRHAENMNEDSILDELINKGYVAG